MSDPTSPIPPPPIHPPPPVPARGGGRALGWFFAVSGAIVLLLTLGCMVVVTGGNPLGDMSGIALLCGSPTLILGGVFLWLGSRRLKR